MEYFIYFLLYYCMDYKYKYIKYKSKYNNLQNGGKRKATLIIMHEPTLNSKGVIPDTIKNILPALKKYCTIYNYWLKLSDKKFTMENLLFDNVANDLHKTFSHMNKFVILALGHAAPYGLYYSNKYPKTCQAIICYPFRYYSKGSLERRIWKLRDNKGYQQNVGKYDVINYMINATNKELTELLIDKTNNGKLALWYLIDYNLQKQYDDIPKKFNTKTILYTRLDIDIESVIEYNFNRTDIASMKKIFSENDAMQQSMVWNFERVKYDAELKKNNINNNNLFIRYIVSGWENYADIINEIMLLTYR